MRRGPVVLTLWSLMAVLFAGTLLIGADAWTDRDWATVVTSCAGIAVITGLAVRYFPERHG